MRPRRDLSLITASGLGPNSPGPGPDDDLFSFAAAHGYEGAQVYFREQAAQARAAGLIASAIAPARTRAEVDSIASYWSGGGVESLTLHLGTGFESAEQADVLVRAVLEAEQSHGTALLIETHRATLFQDPARALELLDRHPDLRCTADLSHWYTGVEFVYGDLDAKFHAIAPLFERVRMIHARISDPGCIQVPIDPSALGGNPPSYVAHFRHMWSAIFEAVSGTAGAPSELPVVVELLPASAHYARTIQVDGVVQEVADRWEQADLHWLLARMCARVAA